MPTTESPNSPPSTKSPVPVGQFSLTLLSNGTWTIQPNSSPPSENSLPSYAELRTFFRSRMQDGQVMYGSADHLAAQVHNLLAQRG